MYNDIVPFYGEIFPLNQAFLAFIPPYLGGPRARVLDLGCGPGDYVNTLSEMGYRVTGIDPSSKMIQGAQRDKRGTFLKFGFSDLGKVDGPFDCIYSIGNSLSYHPEDQMGAFLQDLNQVLRTEGYFILQVVNWDRYRQVGASDFGVKTLSDGRTFHRRYEPGIGSTVIFHTELRGDDSLVQAWSDPLYPKYSDNLCQGIQEAGLRIVDLFGDYQKAPYDPLTSPATILVARKDSQL